MVLSGVVIAWGAWRGRTCMGWAATSYVCCAGQRWMRTWAGMGTGALATWYHRMQLRICALTTSHQWQQVVTYVVPSVCYVDHVTRARAKVLVERWYHQ